MKSQNIYKTDLHLNHVSGQLQVHGIDFRNSTAGHDYTNIQPAQE